MKKADVIAFFGSQKQTAVALCISEAAISQWKDVVPVPRQGHVRLAMEAESNRRKDAEAKENQEGCTHVA